MEDVTAIVNTLDFYSSPKNDCGRKDACTATAQRRHDRLQIESMGTNYACCLQHWPALHTMILGLFTDGARAHTGRGVLLSFYISLPKQHTKRQMSSGHNNTKSSPSNYKSVTKGHNCIIRGGTTDCDATCRSCLYPWRRALQWARPSVHR